MRFIKFFLFLLFYLLIFHQVSISQIFFKNSIIELTFISTKEYENPIKEIIIECTIYNKEDTIKSFGFCYRDSIYKVRLSLSKIGQWNYITKCSDTNNIGLNNKTGSIYIEDYSGNNPLYNKGHIKVSKNKKYLVYDNGDPFFYLGDTAWEITWKSYKEQVLEYISDRKSKGFTVLQIVALSHQYLYSFGVKNRYNDSSFLNNSFDKINPKYFDYLDFIVKTANDSGLIVALVPLWAAESEINTDKNRKSRFLSKEQSLNLAKYLAIRYSGYHLIWIIGGDNSYNTYERRKFWNDFANTIKYYTRNQQLCTNHPMGWSTSFDFFDKSTSWLDFHMYQSSHIAGGDFTWIPAKAGTIIHINKPLLNGEANYEDINNNLWLPGDTSQLKSTRIKPVDIRQASYESILSGAFVGITYGANGIWQWHTEELPGSHLPRYFVDEALHFNGSFSMSILRKIMEKYRWYELQPKYELVLGYESNENYIPVAENSNYGIIYIPKNTKSIKIKKNNNFYNSHYFFINPETGDSLFCNFYDINNIIIPPDSNDWVVIIQKKNYNLENIKWQELNNNIKISNNYPNPFNSQTKLNFALKYPSFIKISIYDILGKKIYDFGENLYNSGINTIIWEPEKISSGIYFIKIQSYDNVKYLKTLYLK
jgi:hypothetical protein